MYIGNGVLTKLVTIQAHLTIRETHTIFPRFSGPAILPVGEDVSGLHLRPTTKINLWAIFCGSRSTTAQTGGSIFTRSTI